jgi:hypothetical protein
MNTRVGKAGMIVLALLVAAGTAFAQDKSVPRSLVKFVAETLGGVGQDAQLVAAVEKDNMKPAAVEKLRDLDKKWQAREIEDFVRTLMGNAVSARLQNQITSFRYIPEAFIMNAQGTIIGETHRTSGYWKGEAAKFTAAYNGGAGATWYGKVEFDESTNTNILQVSVPVVKGGKAIGAICFGVNLDEWEKR